MNFERINQKQKVDKACWSHGNQKVKTEANALEMEKTDLFHLMTGGSGEGKRGKIKSQIVPPDFIWGTGWDGGSGLAQIY